jgi:phosphoglycerate kinase
LTPPANALANCLGRPVKKLDDCVGPDVEAAVLAMAPGDVILLENTRFHKEEKKNDPPLPHRWPNWVKYTSTTPLAAPTAPTPQLPAYRYLHPAVAGFLLEKELNYLGGALANPEPPFLAIMGGAKISDKIKVIENCWPRSTRCSLVAVWPTPFLWRRDTCWQFAGGKPRH